VTSHAGSGRRIGASIRQARAKTDRLDARKLARLLATGELDAVWSPDEWTRVLRRRLARREQLVRARSRSKNEIHAVRPPLVRVPNFGAFLTPVNVSLDRFVNQLLVQLLCHR
jgi:transposase